MPAALPQQPLFQAKTWLVFAVALYALNLLMHFIRAFHIERFFLWTLSPLLRLMGIHKSAATNGIMGLLFGAHLSGVLLFRFAFAVTVLALLSRMLRRMPASAKH